VRIDETDRTAGACMTILWFQPGTHTDEAARLAADAGLTVVTGRCMGALHAQLGLGPGPST
jgi:predicted CoA-binding protein